jgi:PAS domain S-box-containing protein
LFIVADDDVPVGLFRFIEEKLDVGTWYCDVATRHSEWSRGFYRLLGLEHNSVMASYAELERRIHPDDRRCVRDLENWLLSGLPLEREFRIIRNDGRIRWIFHQVEILLDASGKPAKLFGVGIDVTKHREALQSFKVDAERYGALIRASEGWAWISLADGSITALPNRPTAGRAEDPHLVGGTRWLDLVQEDDRASASENWEKAVEAGLTYECRCRLRTSDGNYRVFRAKAVPIPKPHGGVREWMGMFTEAGDESVSGISVSNSGLTGAQLRASRGILNWSVKQLAQRTGVSPAVVRRLEEHDGPSTGHDESVSAIRTAFAEAGIELLFPEVGKPGVRPR